MSSVVKGSCFSDHGDDARFRRSRRFFAAQAYGTVLLFRSRAMTRDSGDHGDRRAARATALCLRPSATTPPPISVLLKTKIKPQFDRAVTDRSKAIVLVFQGSNRGQFQPCFCFLTVRSAEGRKTEVVWVFWLIASCWLLVFKDRPITAFPHWKEIAQFTICSPRSQAKALQ